MKHKRAIIFLTGKPGVGKDTLAEGLKSYRNIPHYKLADPLIDCMKTMFNVEDEYIEHINQNRELKEQTNEVFLGKSYRECMIWLAEECIKPKFGKDFFIKNLLRRIDQKKFKDVFCVSDLGFVKDELSHIDPDKYNVYVVKITRENIDTSIKDSREDITENIYDTIVNDGTVDQFILKGKNILNRVCDDIININKQLEETESPSQKHNKKKVTGSDG